MPQRQCKGDSKAGDAAKVRAAGTSHQRDVMQDYQAQLVSGSASWNIDDDAALAQKLQEQMDLENQQCELDRRLAKDLIDEDMAELLCAKAELSGQRQAHLDPLAVSQDLVSRTFLCPIVKDVVCKGEGESVGRYNAQFCNHWVSNEALKEYICHAVSETLDPASVPCPQCLAEPCERCATHGQPRATGVPLCCFPELQVRSFLTEELTVRVARRAFAAYRQEHLGHTIKCPEPSCDYWCEVEDGDFGEQEAAGYELKPAGLCDAGLDNEDSSSDSADSTHQFPRRQARGEDAGAWQGEYGSERSSEEGHISADPFGYGASTSDGSTHLSARVAAAQGQLHGRAMHGRASHSAIDRDGARRVHGRAAHPATVNHDGANQGQAAATEQAVVTERIEMLCGVCNITYCLYCSQHVGVPVRAHGGQSCGTVIEERRELGHGRSAARKRMEAEKRAMLCGAAVACQALGSPPHSRPPSTLLSTTCTPTGGHSRGSERTCLLCSQKEVKGILWQECPRCKVQAWKISEECNMMTCRCSSKFCFLCGEDVSVAGHNHFADGASACNNRCWHRPEGNMQGFAPCRCGAPGCDAR